MNLILQLASSASLKVTASLAASTLVALSAVITTATCSAAKSTNLFVKLAITHTIILDSCYDDNGGILLGSDDDECVTLPDIDNDDGALRREGAEAAAGGEEQLHSGSGG